MKARKLDIFTRLSAPFSYFRAPTSFNNINHDSIPNDYINLDGFRITEEAKQSLKVTFLGDMMGVGIRDIKLCDNLIKRIHASDYTIINLSSVLTNDYSMVLDKQHTHPQIFLKFCDQLPMEKVVFSLANSHIMDYGKNGLQNTLIQLRRVGAKIIGLKDQSTIELAKGLKLKASTSWYTDKNITSNLDELSAETSTLHYIHWGEEYKTEPSNEQIEHIKKLSENDLLVCGHHSHCPQPIKIIDDKLAAFSLGNFTSFHDSSRINSGLVMTTDLVLYDKWHIEKVNWTQLDIKATQDVQVSEIH